MNIEQYLKFPRDLGDQYKKKNNITKTLILIGIFLFLLFLIVQCREKVKLYNNLKTNQRVQTQTLVQFRQFFESNIRPTFRIFSQQYRTDQSLQKKFRLSKEPQISSEENQYIQEIFKTLEQLDSSQIYENVITGQGDTSYTIDKKNIYMCLRNYFNDTQVDTDILVFVFLHECAHIVCRDQQHSYEFWCIFRLILDVFCNFENRVYKHINLCTLNMEKSPLKYCNSMQITYNPLFDPNTYMTFI